MSALICTKCNDKEDPGLLIPTTTGAGHHHFECRKCGFSASSEKVDNLLTAVRKQQEKAKTIDEMEALLAKQQKRLFKGHSSILELKSNIMAALGKVTPKRSPDQVEKYLRLLEERIRLIETVDGGESRLLGFLAYKMHCCLIEKILLSRGLTDIDEETAKKLKDTLDLAVNILKDDISCPKDILQLVKNGYKVGLPINK